jgi:hypothetical protein
MRYDMDKLHKHIAKGFGNHDVSPATLAYKMLNESKYVNESVLQYMVNYINIMANSKIVPMHLLEIREVCKYLNISLQELGLVGEVGRVSNNQNEYLAI